MCGLVGIFSKKGKRAGHMVIQTYRNQQARGRAGFGYIAISGNKIVGIERSKEEGDIIKALNKEEAEFIMFHHRLPTSTKNTIGTTHPIFVSHEELEYDYYLAHNGVLNNDYEMKRKHEALGYLYTTEHTEDTVITYKDGRVEHNATGATKFNDSECLAIEMARYAEGLTKKVGVKGSAAFWMIQMVKGTNTVKSIFYGKNYGRELKEIDNKKFWGISSQTGSDLAEMILYRLNMKEWTIDELELNIHDNQTIKQATGFDQTRTLNNVDRYKEWSSSAHAYSTLQNKYYTWGEMCDTGIPTSEFFQVIHMSQRMYVPIKFAGDPDGRLSGLLGTRTLTINEPPALPTPRDVDLTFTYDGVEVDEKAKDLLEGYTLEIAEIENRIQEIIEGDEESDEARNEAGELSLRLQALEESVSALGLPEELVEETMDLSRDIADNYQSVVVRDSENDNVYGLS